MRMESAVLQRRLELARANQADRHRGRARVGAQPLLEPREHVLVGVGEVDPDRELPGAPLADALERRDLLHGELERGTRFADVATTSTGRSSRTQACTFS